MSTSWSKLHLNSTLTPLLNSSHQLGEIWVHKLDLNSNFWIPVLILNLKSRTKCFEFLILNRINLLLSYLFVKAKLEKLRGHSVVPVMSHNLTCSSWLQSTCLWTTNLCICGQLIYHMSIIVFTCLWTIKLYIWNQLIYHESIIFSTCLWTTKFLICNQLIYQESIIFSTCLWTIKLYICDQLIYHKSIIFSICLWKTNICRLNQLIYHKCIIFSTCLWTTKLCIWN